MILLQPYQKYADFSGRANRAEYWLFLLVYLVVIIVAANINSALLVVFFLASIIPHLAVSVRRLHDTNRSGGWIFITLVPFIGDIWFLILCLLAGDDGPNQYGTPP